MSIRSFCILFLAIVFVNCSTEKEQTSANTNSSIELFDHSTFKLIPGDILFQDSDCGPFCEAIEKVTFGVNGAKFSHVGMVIPEANNQLVIIEAITAGVVKTPLDTFFNRSFDADG